MQQEICPNCHHIFDPGQTISDEWAGWALDNVKQSVKTEAGILFLQHHPFLILSCLVHARGKMVSKADLLRAMYKDNSIRQRRSFKTIEVRICQLRTVLMDLGIMSAIETVWGGGYALRPFQESLERRGLWQKKSKGGLR